MKSLEGYLYILTSPCMPNIYKIGHTQKSVEERIKELSTSTSVPLPFKEFLSFYVPDSLQAEKLLHEELRKYRLSTNREFFRIEDKAAIYKALKCLANEFSDIVGFYSEVLQTSFGAYFHDIEEGIKDIFTEDELKTINSDYDLFFKSYSRYSETDGQIYWNVSQTDICSVEDFKNALSRLKSEVLDKKEVLSWKAV